MTKTSTTTRDSKRFDPKIPPGQMYDAVREAHGLTGAQACEVIHNAGNAFLRALCARKQFDVVSGHCAGGAAGAATKVDLIVLIDTSGSMQDEATNLSNAAAAAIAAAQTSCPSDLRVAWFGIEGTWAGTNFAQSYRDYLHGLGVPDASLVGTPFNVGGTDAQEDGAAAVIDLSNYFDWRPGAERTIFYLGDEALEGGDPQDANDVNAANAAISTANAHGVKVFTYFGTAAGNPAATIAEYAKLATQTGGQAFVAPVANIGGFQAVLEKVICGSSSEACSEIEFPKVIPCLHLRWGDGPEDHLETEDTEILCITVCNPYSNVTLKNFTLSLVVTDTNGALVKNQADGTPSVIIKPNLNICFDDIPPCDPKEPDRPSCVSREVVMINRGAIAGKYKIAVVYCFDVSYTQFNLQPDAFEVELVKS